MERLLPRSSESKQNTVSDIDIRYKQLCPGFLREQIKLLLDMSTMEVVTKAPVMASAILQTVPELRNTTGHVEKAAD